MTKQISGAKLRQRPAEKAAPEKKRHVTDDNLPTAPPRANITELISHAQRHTVAPHRSATPQRRQTATISAGAEQISAWQCTEKKSPAECV